MAVHVLLGGTLVVSLPWVPKACPGRQRPPTLLLRPDPAGAALLPLPLQGDIQTLKVKPCLAAAGAYAGLRAAWRYADPGMFTAIMLEPVLAASPPASAMHPTMHTQSFPHLPLNTAAPLLLQDTVFPSFQAVLESFKSNVMWVAAVVAAVAAVYMAVKG